MPGQIPTGDIHHLRLTVTDLERSRQFYTSLLGFQVAVESGAVATTMPRNRSGGRLVSDPGSGVGSVAEAPPGFGITSGDRSGARPSAQASAPARVAATRMSLENDRQSGIR